MLMKNRPAAVWKRVLAFLLDLYLGLAVASALISLIIPSADIGIANAIAEPSLIVTPFLAAAFLYLALFIVLYHVACEYIVGQTPGMLLFGLSIKNKRANDKESLTFGQALIRNLFLIPLFPFYLFWLIEPLFYVFQGERLLEYWTKTETVE